MDIRKNLDNLVRAFAKVVPQMPELKLVITGNNRKMGEELKKETEAWGVENSVVLPGYVEEKVLWSLIRQANCICYPSLIEGFGGPVLEGFAAGVPVITSDTSSLPEVAGEAALQVEPESEEEITQAILKVVREKETRNRLIEKGKERVKQFSWEKTAAEVIKIYKEALRCEPSSP
jgi:glycosyltransferase involved in cell wall biosynthesis